MPTDTKQDRDPRIVYWDKTFISHLRDDPRASNICADLIRTDSSALAFIVREYLEGRDKLADERKERGVRLMSKLQDGITGLTTAAEAYEVLGDSEAAGDIDGRAQYLAGKLELAQEVFSTKRLGVAGKNLYLFLLELYVEQRTGRRPTSGELALLVEAGKMAAGYQRHPDMDPEQLRKNLQNFKKNNPVLCNLLREHAQQVFATLEHPATAFYPLPWKQNSA